MIILYVIAVHHYILCKLIKLQRVQSDLFETALLVMMY